MAKHIEVEVGGDFFTGHTASAKDQVEMLQISAKSGLLPAVAPGVSDFALLAVVATVGGDQLERLKTLCLKNGNIVRQSDSVPVAENLFQDEAHNYLVLIGKVLRENIGPFWQLSSKDSSDIPGTDELQA